MRMRTLFVLTVVALLVTACGAATEASTTLPAPSATSPAATEAAAPTAAPSATAAIAATESVAATTPITATGGVEIALAALQKMEGTLATVNGQAITWAEYEPELIMSLYAVTSSYQVDWNQADNIALLPQFQDSILETVVQRTLLRQEAPKEVAEPTEAEVQAHVEEQKLQILAGGQYASWDEFKELAGVTDEYYARLMADDLLVQRITEAHAPAREAEQVHARHILVSDEAVANQVVERLAAGEDFATLAAELSEDTGSKDKGGDLGWFPAGVMIAEFEEAAFALEAGETSGPVQSYYGYHIIQVLEKGLHELDESTYSTLKSQAFTTWIQEARAAAQVEILVKFAAEG